MIREDIAQQELLIVLSLFLLLAFLPIAGAGLWFSALNVKYRDFRYVVPY